MKPKACSYCGNPNIEVKEHTLKNGKLRKEYWCSFCSNTLSGGMGEFYTPGEFLTSAAVISTELLWGQWQEYLFVKQDSIIFKLDISNDNLCKCENIYNSNPKDVNNLIRLVLINILKGNNFKPYIKELISFWNSKKIGANTIINISLAFADLGDKEFKYHTPKLKLFFVWLINIKKNDFISELKTYHNNEFSTLHLFWEIIGTENMESITDVFKIYFDDIYLDEGYLESYALAEYCYNRKDYFQAYLLFEKLNIYNRNYEITDVELGNEAPLYFLDIADIQLPTVQSIAEKTKISFAKLIESGNNENIREIICILSNRLKDKEDKIARHEKDLFGHKKMLNLFSCIIGGKYEDALKEWISWEKRNSSIGKAEEFDIWELTKLLSGCTDKINKKKLSEFVEKAYIPCMVHPVEFEIRDFIKENYILVYRDTKNAWFHLMKNNEYLQNDKFIKTGDFDSIRFKHFYDIINSDWDIFKKAFILTSEDKSINHRELTKFIKTIHNIRNDFTHKKITLANEEVATLNASIEKWNNIYENWVTKKSSQRHQKNIGVSKKTLGSGTES